MRVFVAVRHSQDPRFYYGGLWINNFRPALEKLGCEVVESQVDLLPASRFLHIGADFTPQELVVRQKISEEIVAKVQREHQKKPLDLFLSYFYNAHFDPDAFEEIHRLGIPTVNFYCNSVYQFDLVDAIAPKARFAWHAEKPARENYLQVGANPVWVQMAADPEVYQPVEGLERAPQACFVGQRYADRDRWMAALIRAQVPVEIYGPGWGAPEKPAASPQEKPCQEKPQFPPLDLGRPALAPGSLKAYAAAARESIRRQGLPAGLKRLVKQVAYRRESRRLAPLFRAFARGAVPFQEIFRVFGSHEVILNFSNVWADGRPGSALIPHVRLRDFEAPMCRTCYLTGHTEEIEEFYQPDKEIATYRTPEELIDKTRFYLAHPDAAEALREAGFQRARRDHAWTNRFEELFEKIGLKRGLRNGG